MLSFFFKGKENLSLFRSFANHVGVLRGWGYCQLDLFLEWFHVRSGFGESNIHDSDRGSRLHKRIASRFGPVGGVVWVERPPEELLVGGGIPGPTRSLRPGPGEHCLRVKPPSSHCCAQVRLEPAGPEGVVAVGRGRWDHASGNFPASCPRSCLC